jgi:glycosyltransferase involved in cell wall biosynthesis
MISEAAQTIRVSVCSPVHNEEGNLVALVNEIHQVMEPLYGAAWEQVLVDDGSTDRSAAIMAGLCEGHRLQLLSHEHNQGERAAWKTAFDHARGEIVVMLAADLQNDPRDIPRLVQGVETGGVDCCTGRRVQRKDGLYYRAATRVLNAYMATFFSLEVEDVSSSFFAVRRRFAAGLPLLDNDHRYILPIFKQRGAIVREIPTAHYGRRSGRSHYSRAKVLRAIPEVLRFSARCLAGRYDVR